MCLFIHNVIRTNENKLLIVMAMSKLWFQISTQSMNNGLMISDSVTTTTLQWLEKPLRIASKIQTRYMMYSASHGCACTIWKILIVQCTWSNRLEHTSISCCIGSWSLSSLPYPMITHTPLIASNLHIKPLVAKQLPTSTMSCVHQCNDQILATSTIANL